jgi:predicted Fe-Mo cluster-binding NifX family protein
LRQAISNENIVVAGGAGIQAAQFVPSEGVRSVITGHCGPNAVRTLSAAGIGPFLDQTGTAREALEKTNGVI